MRARLAAFSVIALLDGVAAGDGYDNPTVGRELALQVPGMHRAVVKKNAGASLVDLGDGVLCVEFHSKMNAIGGDTIEMINAGVQEAAKNFTALVVGNDAPNFSAGANLMLLLLEAQEGNWDEIDLMIRAFQKGTMALKLADVPVVVAPAGGDLDRRGDVVDERTVDLDHGSSAAPSAPRDTPPGQRHPPKRRSVLVCPLGHGSTAPPWVG